VTLLQGPEISDQALAHSQGVRQQFLILDDAHVFQGRSRSRGTSGKGRDIAEIRQRVLGIILKQIEYGF